MKMLQLGARAGCSMFSTAEGADEFFLFLESRSGRDFAAALMEIETAYNRALETNGLSLETQAFSRLFLSDIENQEKELRKSSLFTGLASSAVSIIQQKAVNGAKINLMSYHIRPKGGENLGRAVKNVNGTPYSSVALTGRNYKMLWNANYSGNGVFDSRAQMDGILQSLDSDLGAHGMAMAEHMVRTWVYVHDIDNHYGGMVQSRKEFFSSHGLTAGTRYFASTGIEGRNCRPGSLVSLDSFSISPLAPGQMMRMEALEHLSPTINYGVTFERGMRIDFGDRSHFYISGTASIDSNGALLYPGDPRRQTERTLENILALLSPHGLGLEDMAYFLVYVRSAADEAVVREVLDGSLPREAPRFILEAPVCRPGWLVEIEGVGIKAAVNHYPAFI